MGALGDNLRRLRKQADLTQAQLATRVGLPRATLASLEQPGANPGMQTVLAVAKALGVSLDDLLHPRPAQRHYKVTARDQQEYRAEAGRFVARLVSPIASKGVQLHHLTLQPGCRSIGRPHPMGAQEFFYCLSGAAVLHIEDEEVAVETGSLVQFPGHRRHIYENRHAREAVVAISAVVMHLG